ncbi:hypothetical protein V8E53_010239 [Lactarius tabidus]
MRNAVHQTRLTSPCRFTPQDAAHVLVYFTLDIILVSNGILHPREHPETVIGLWGQWITAQIVYQSVLGDSIVIWRAWIVWNRQISVVIAPLVLLFGVAFLSFGMAVTQSQVSTDPSCLAAFRKFMIALPSLTLATNITATTLILLRLGCGRCTCPNKKWSITVPP